MPAVNVGPAQHCDVTGHVARTGKVKEMASDLQPEVCSNRTLKIASLMLESHVTCLCLVPVIPRQVS